MNEDFYNNVMSHDIIYSLLYSPVKIDGDVSTQIVWIQTSMLHWAQDKQSFFYVWGFPGPDYNEYAAATYGKGWAFTKEEIVNAWNDNEKIERLREEFCASDRCRLCGSLRCDYTKEWMEGCPDWVNFLKRATEAHAMENVQEDGMHE